MPTPTVTPHYNLFEKAPERRRRSVWNRLRRRPAQLALVVVLTTVAAMVVTYAALRAAQLLPAQRRAQQTLVAAQRVTVSPVFETEVIKPLEAFLNDGLPIARNSTPFADFVARSVGGELPLKSVLPPTRPARSEVIANWRVVMRSLEREDVRIYGLPGALRRGDAWLRDFIAARLAHADAALAHVTSESRSVDLGVAAVLRYFDVSSTELDGIVYVAERARRLRSPAAR